MAVRAYFSECIIITFSLAFQVHLPLSQCSTNNNNNNNMQHWHSNWMATQARRYVCVRLRALTNTQAPRVRALLLTHWQPGLDWLTARSQGSSAVNSFLSLLHTRRTDGGWLDHLTFNKICHWFVDVDGQRTLHAFWHPVVVKMSWQLSTRVCQTMIFWW